MLKLLSLPWSGGANMSLSLKQRLLASFVPSSLYYRGRIADEAAWGEHELSVLPKLVPRGGTAIDVGANDGVFAFALSSLVDRVEAFEPNPDYALFARRMLGSRAGVHQVALSNTTGRAEFVVPVSEEGTVLHLGGSLRPSPGPAGRALRFDVAVRTLDSYAFENVRLVKIDVEGSEMEVLEGGRQTIERHRPALIVELLTGTHADPIELTQEICRLYRYQPWIVTKEGGFVEALPVIQTLQTNTTWGSPILNRNILFLSGDTKGA
jgi:FkbM family methyltransferase